MANSLTSCMNLSLCYVLKVYVPPNSCIGALAVIIGDEAFGGSYA